MREIFLIRHGMTPGNSLGRYIGVTDEPLSPEGKEQLREKTWPVPERVFTSPLKRCLESAAILFPGVWATVIPELSECNFGEFEGKNYLELSDNPSYQAWIDSDGLSPFPGGESREQFQKRTLQGFERVLSICKTQNLTRAALVVHGGTIMTIMEKYGEPKKSFYEWHVKNGDGYCLQFPD